MLSTALFFYGVAGEREGKTNKAKEKIARVEKLRRVAEPAHWQVFDTPAGEQIKLYVTTLSEPVSAHPEYPPREMKFVGPGGEYEYNPKMLEGLMPSAYQYAFRDNQVWITLPPGVKPPSPASPGRFQYYTAPAVSDSVH